MARIRFWLMVTTGTVLAVLGSRAISAQDQYSLQVPNGLAFSEFRGNEDWQTVVVSQTQGSIEDILANPLMIDAYRAWIFPGRAWGYAQFNYIRHVDGSGPIAATRATR